MHALEEVEKQSSQTFYLKAYLQSIQFQKERRRKGYFDLF